MPLSETWGPFAFLRAYNFFAVKLLSESSAFQTKAGSMKHLQNFTIVNKMSTTLEMFFKLKCAELMELVNLLVFNFGSIFYNCKHASFKR